MISVGVKWGHEAQSELKAYLAAAIAAKEQKLQGIVEPHVLLILDAYHYSHLADWKHAIMDIPERQSFQVIARVSPSGGTDVIWQSSGWLDA
jgi:hypothetical protein